MTEALPFKGLRPAKRFRVGVELSLYVRFWSPQ
jgi:hypothetical protein